MEGGRKGKYESSMLGVFKPQQEGQCDLNRENDERI